MYLTNLTSQLLLYKWGCNYKDLSEIYHDNEVGQKQQMTTNSSIQFVDTLNQWFSTFSSWRPTKQKNTQFGDPNVSACDPKVGRDPADEKHCHK